MAIVTQSQTSRRLNQHALALQRAEEAIELVSRVADPRLSGLANFALGYAQASLFDGRPYFEVALADFRRAGDLSGICLALLVLAAYTDLEHVHEAVPLENEAIKIAEEMGSMSHLVLLWLNHSVSCFLLGEAADAEAFARRVLVASR
jgi:tetratricopeptide (TPR) repeat protein